MNMLSNYFRSVVNINRSKRILKIKSYENLIKSLGHDKLSELLKNTNTLLYYFILFSYSFFISPESALEHALTFEIFS